MQVGGDGSIATTITLFEYDPDKVVERKMGSIAEYMESDSVCEHAWLDIDGLNSDKVLLLAG